MKYVVCSLLLAAAFSSPIYAAGAACFSHECFDHVNVPGGLPALTNSAGDNYPDSQRRLNHAVVVAAAIPIQVRLGRFTAVPPAAWDVQMPFVGAPPVMNLANINLMIVRRQQHGVVVAPALLANLAAANLAGAITAPLTASLQAGGYLNNTSAILNRLTLPAFPVLTILGVLPLFVPDSVIVHVSLPQRVSRNLNEFSHSSLATAVPGGLTLKDKINAPFIAGGMALPDSITVVSSTQLQ